MIRVDIISDTHGLLSEELLRELQGADQIIHAGDVTSRSDVERLRKIAPLHLCLGNNDYTAEYGPDIGRIARFTIDGVRFQVVHYKEQTTPLTADVCVFGHTHRPGIDWAPNGCLMINPGSPTMPRTKMGPTMARLYIDKGEVKDPKIIQLSDDDEPWWARWF